MKLAFVVFLFAGGVLPTASVVFNVQDYGAKADGRTNNTAAFSACLDALVAAGGGKMYLPAGLYRGRILVPAIHPIAQSLVVEIVGDMEPMPRFGTVGAWPFGSSNSTSVVQSVADSGSAVITATSASGTLVGIFWNVKFMFVSW